MQRALIIEGGLNRRGLGELNEMLSREWEVVQICAMPSATGSESSLNSMPPTCLVIVEDKIGRDKKK